MNARFIQKMFDYKNSPYAQTAVCILLHQKIKNQFHLIKEDAPTIEWKESPNQILVTEAVYAKKYWKAFSALLPQWVVWKGRKPKSKDIVNQALDIGYHFITNMIKNKIIKFDMYEGVGLLHKAQSKNSAPLAYDFVEWLRPEIDKIILNFFRQKKKPLKYLQQKQIAYLIAKIKERFDHKYFNSKRGDCITLDYWVDLVVLDLRNAISKKREFKPHFPPYRHENRCKNKIPNHKD